MPEISRTRARCRRPNRKKNADSHGASVAKPGGAGNFSLPDNQGTVAYFPGFCGSSQADAIYDALLDAEGWQCTPITFFGKQVLQPRETAFYGTELYTYSDERRPPIPWDRDDSCRTLLSLKRRIEIFLELPEDYFNVALCNKYTDGTRYMGYHADDETSLGEYPIIASFSCGAERRFLVKPKLATASSESPRIEWHLAHGSLLVMSGQTQKYYKHSLPKQTRIKEARLNFTFRRVINSDMEKASILDNDYGVGGKFWAPLRRCAAKKSW